MLYSIYIIYLLDSADPVHQWWAAAESEEASLFGSYSHMRNQNESVADMQSATLLQTEVILCLFHFTSPAIWFHLEWKPSS